jgi:hypothetical protein
MARPRPCTHKSASVEALGKGLPILRRDCFDTIDVGHNVFHRKFVVYALCAGRMICKAQI